MQSHYMTWPAAMIPGSNVNRNSSDFSINNDSFGTAQTEQYSVLMSTEGVSLSFSKDGYVDVHLDELAGNEDLSRYIL